MGNKTQLIERHKEQREKADAILKIAEASGSLTEDQQKACDEHLAECERISKELEGIERLEKMRAKVDGSPSYPVPGIVSGQPVEPTPAGQPKVEFNNDRNKYEKGDALSAIVAARIQFAGYEKPAAERWVERMYGSGSLQLRALQQSSFTAGGALIPENFVGAEFIELLKAEAKVRQAGARQVTLVNGSFTTPKLTGGVTGYWSTAEGANITPSDPTFGQLKLTEKKYTALTPFSNDLKRNASLDAIRVVRDDMVRTAANDEDAVFLKGDGLAGKPMGIYYWVGSSRRSNSGGTSLANLRTDVRTALNSLDTANAPNRSRAWFMHSRPANYIGWELVDANSNLVFPEMQKQSGAMLAGAPVYRDNNISIVTGTGAQTEFYYVEMSECFIADAMDLEIEIFENAVYADSAGTLRSGISRDESCIRLIRKTDFGMRHAESGYVIEAVSY